MSTASKDTCGAHGVAAWYFHAQWSTRAGCVAGRMETASAMENAISVYAAGRSPVSCAGLDTGTYLRRLQQATDCATGLCNTSANSDRHVRQNCMSHVNNHNDVNTGRSPVSCAGLDTDTYLRRLEQGAALSARTDACWAAKLASGSRVVSSLQQVGLVTSRNHSHSHEAQPDNYFTVRQRRRLLGRQGRERLPRHVQPAAGAT